ncbi:hypothetical protein BSKO_05553 [Bryopsis sp. KO-2023]|nr:hypothetical protein BSKO_05553 [Bryopsis sp. KO-2023]
MMKSMVLCALVLALAVSSAYGRGLAQTDATCAATSSIEIIVKGGSCDAQAVVTCQASATAKSEFESAFIEWWADDFDGHVCDSQRRDAAARAVATAIAQVAVSAFGKITCTDYADVEGCAWGVGKADAWAIATAEALAVAMVDFGQGRSFCEADVTALAASVVDVTGKAQADACVKGGEISNVDFESIFVKGIQKSVAEAFASATASFCNTGDGVFAESKCKGQGSSLGEGGVTIIGDGEGKGKAAKVPTCSGEVEAKCCVGDFNASICLCRGDGCPWERTSDFTSNAARTWAARRGGMKCFCK